MSNLRYGSLFSGVGGFDLGFAAAGFECLFQCEIDKQASAVLERRFPGVPRHGDVTTFDPDDYECPDVICWGSPCQDLSVAGKRKGLVGQRSGLFYEGIRIIESFVQRGLRFSVWENVPGALSSHGGRDFSAVLGAFLKFGARDVAWASLDSQWFGVAQRRKRLFVVADFGGEYAGEILSLSEGLSGHPAPSRSKGEGVAPSIAGSLGGGGGERGYRNDLDTSGAFIPEGVSDCARSLRAQSQSSHREDSETFVVAGPLSARGGKGPNTTLDDGAIIGTLAASGAGTERPAGQGNEVDFLIPIQEVGKRTGSGGEGQNGCGSGLEGEPMFTLQAAAQHAIAFGWNKSDSQTMRLDSEACNASQASESSNPAIAFTQNSRDEVRLLGGEGAGDVSLSAQPGMKQQSYVALNQRGRKGGSQMEASDVASVRSASGGSSRSYVGSNHSAMAVRRLMPVECERLMGWPDGFTEGFADGPRYRMCGNGVVAPVAEWIARRVAEALR